MDALKAVRDLGMPLRDEHFTKGNLFIKFNITFPPDGSLSPEQVAVLKAALPGPETPPPMVDEDVEEVYVATMNLEAEAKAAREREREAYDESDEEERGGAREVQCAQQ